MTDEDAVSQEVAAAYYDDEITANQLTGLVSGETAQRLRLLKGDLADEPLNLAAPDGVNVYGGDATAIDAAANDY